MSKKLISYRLKDTLPYNFKDEEMFNDYMSELADKVTTCKEKFTSLAISVPNDICPKSTNDPLSYVADMCKRYMEDFNAIIGQYSQCVIISDCSDKLFKTNIEFVVSSEIETYEQAEKLTNELLLREGDAVNKLKALFYATPNSIVNGNINPFDYVIGKTTEYFDELLEIREQLESVALLIDNLALKE